MAAVLTTVANTKLKHYETINAIHHRHRLFYTYRHIHSCLV